MQFNGFAVGCSLPHLLFSSLSQLTSSLSFLPLCHLFILPIYHQPSLLVLVQSKFLMQQVVIHDTSRKIQLWMCVKCGHFSRQCTCQQELQVGIFMHHYHFIKIMYLTIEQHDRQVRTHSTNVLSNFGWHGAQCDGGGAHAVQGGCQLDVWMEPLIDQFDALTVRNWQVTRTAREIMIMTWYCRHYGHLGSLGCLDCSFPEVEIPSVLPSQVVQLELEKVLSSM